MHAAIPRIAAQTWTIRHQLCPEETDELLIALADEGDGYSGVEISETGGMSLLDFCQAVDDSPLAIAGIHLPCMWGVRPVASEVREAVGYVMECVRQFPDYEFLLSFMGHPTMLKSSLRLTRQRYKEAALLFRMVQHQFSDIPNATYAYHLYDFDFRAGDDCIGEIVSSGVDVVLDTYFANVAELDPLELIWRWRSHISSVHLNDHQDHEHRALGAGNANFPEIAQELGRQQCKLHSMVVEHEPDNSTTGTEMLLKSVAYLRRQQLDHVYRDHF